MPGETSSPTRPEQSPTTISMGEPSRAELHIAYQFQRRSSLSIPTSAGTTGDEKKTPRPIGRRFSTKPRNDNPILLELKPELPPPGAVLPDALDIRPSAVVVAELVSSPLLNRAIVRIPKPEARIEQACDAAFSKAQAVMNHHDDAQSCLAYLNQKPNATDACPETIERQTLRRRCSDK